MDVAWTLLQSASGDATTPLVVVGVLALLVVGGALLSRRGDRSFGGPSTATTASGEVVCPRCNHTADPTTNYCPECGKDLG